MKIYNTLTGQVDEVRPQQPPTVTVYTCGPTVYDYAHIGHWFNYVRMDTLIRGLIANGLRPQWVMNITDVGHLTSDADEGEDKLETGARREGKSAWEVAEFYTRDFLAGMKSLNILEPWRIVKATDHIAEQVELIQRLEAKGYTYVIDDGVYYDTAKFERYADFARLDLDEQQAGARVLPNPQKRNSADFALWKFSPAGRQRDMEWDSPWGKGFPGWHIECSAMSMKYLGETLDIHTGGIDHVPVHHTNEIAQSEAATGKRFANYWLHGNHVTINDQKISKSLGNGVRLQDIYDRGVSAQAVRLHVLESHYRSQSKFSWESLAAAENRLNDLRAMAVLRWQTKDKSAAPATISLNDVAGELTGLVADDLNTPQALTFLSRVSAELLAGSLAHEQLSDFEAMLNALDAILGLRLAEEPDITSEQKHLIEDRDQARRDRDWKKSDQLRAELAEQKIGLRDTDQGAIWFPL